MIQVSAYPTVEWLRTRAADRKAIAKGPGRFDRQTMMTRVASRLREVLSPDVRIERNVWIATPEGELDVSIVLEKGNKRIALCETQRYRLDSDLSDALILVYGRFDSLYRVKGDSSTSSMHDLVYGLMCAMPDWFTHFGRLSAGRNASAEALLTGNLEKSPSGEQFASTHIRMKRMRLCVASDWVNEFERALSCSGRISAA